MQFLAQISKAPTAHKSSYWEDVARTEQWLGSLHKQVTHRTLWLHARTVDHLLPWLDLQRRPLTLEGWLLPMEVGATWRYLHDFLAGQGPDEMGIPCGGDSLVVWRPGHIALRAPRDSWVWVALDHVWPRAAGPCLDALAWHQDTRTHQGRRYAWGHVEQQIMANGWEERTVRAERGGEGTVENIWQHLLTRLGTRAVRIQWRQELPGPSVRLLGLPVRLSRVDLRVETDTPWDGRIAGTWPEPSGLKVRAEWEVPRWNAHWATRVRLRRFKDGSRLEAVYVTEAHAAPEAQRLLCQERRRLPIFTLETVHPSHPGRRWTDLERRASEAGRLDALARATRLVAWPRPAAVQYPRRLRPAWPGWRVSRLESTAGRWTWVHLPTDIRITIDLPQPGSPGNLNVALPGAPGLTMRDLDPEVKIDRFHSDWRYWVYLALEYLMPTVSRHAPKA